MGERLVCRSAGRADFHCRALELGHAWSGVGEGLERGFSTGSSWANDPLETVQR